MNKTELQHLYTILKMASGEFSNNGCNEMDLPNTPENRQFIAAAEMWNSPENFAEKGSITISEDGTN